MNPSSTVNDLTIILPLATVIGVSVFAYLLKTANRNLREGKEGNRGTKSPSNK